jgi:signal transduction histidine kinase
LRAGRRGEPESRARRAPREDDHGVTQTIPRWLRAALASTVLVAAITAVIALLEPGVPALGLGVVYLLAVVPIALVYGFAVAAAVSVASMAAFSYFFLPPRHSLSPGTSERWSVLVAFVVSSVVVSQLAARSQREARRSARLADQEAARRRVATLVAGGAPPPEVFAAVAREVGQLLGVDATHVARYELDGTATAVAAWSPAADQAPIGTRVELEGETVTGSVFRTGRPARMLGYEHASGAGAALGRELGLRSSVGAPIVVDQRLWGAMIASSKLDRPLPEDAESRIAAFAELVAAAISNTESRAGLALLGEEQAALRRVATLAARGTSPEELFAAVVEEAGRVFLVENVGLARYESGATMTTVAISERLAQSFPVGGRWPLGGKNVSTIVSETGRAARIDSYGDATGQLGVAMRARGLASSVGAPIVVEGHVWGVMTLASTEQPLPADAEARLASFTDLVATAIANTESQAGLARLAEEQAALRRVATLVAAAVPSEEVFAAVTEEIGQLLPVEYAHMGRYEADSGTIVFIAAWGKTGPVFPVGTRMVLGGRNVPTLVFETARPARIDLESDGSGPLAVALRERGVRWSVGTPIMVEGRVWGLMAAGTIVEQHLLPDTEGRLAQFTELVATAIANAEARAEVAASRTRIVAATDEERRRVVRDLHDGAQQRLVNTIITLKLARQALEQEQEAAPELVDEALDHAEGANAELRELAHGILPAALSQGGLRAGVDALASRSPVPVETDVSVDRLPAAVEATAYFVVAEALTNVAKHARARHAHVTAQIDDGTLRVQVRDDGVGGARPDGSGLIGLADRLTALNGKLRVDSAADGGTLVAAAIPLPS